MRNLDKYKGVIPAFYACYDKDGNISPEAVQALTKYFVEKGVKGVYVNGSSGECIYQSVEDRKIVLENVMKAAEGKLTVKRQPGTCKTCREPWGRCNRCNPSDLFPFTRVCNCQVLE